MIERNYVTEMGTMSIYSLKLNWKKFYPEYVSILFIEEIYLFLLDKYVLEENI